LTNEADKQLHQTVSLLKTQLSDSERRLRLHTTAAAELWDLVKGLRLSLSHLDPNGSYDAALQDFKLVGKPTQRTVRRPPSRRKKRVVNGHWKVLAVEALSASEEPLNAAFLQAFLEKKGHALKKRYINQWLSACNKDSEDGVVRVGRGLYTCNEEVVNEYAS
jgi:hypothetical protein